MRRTILFLIIIALCRTAPAQDLDSLLGHVEANNKTLKALKSAQEAQDLQLKSENRLSDPTVEYSPFFHKGSATTVFSSELIVEQEFDFPTLYASRKKANEMESQALSSEYLVQRRDILLEAKNLYIDLVHNQDLTDMTTRRLERADSIALMSERLSKEREATLLDVNKARMELMTLKAQLSRLQTERTEILSKIQALSGGNEFTPAALAYPLDALPGAQEKEGFIQSAAQASQDVQSANYRVQAMEQNLKVQKQSALPKLSLGFRRNTEERLAYNGFLVSTSIPLFSTKGKVRQAKSLLSSSSLMSEQAVLDATARIKTAYEEAESLRASIEAYDPALMEQTLELLFKSRALGQITVIDYFREADLVYNQKEELEELRCAYYKALSHLLSYKL